MTEKKHKTGAADEAGIKSAYELAMERLGGGQVSPAGLTEEQKQVLAAIDRETGAKVAEQEILFKSRIQTALANADLDGATKLRTEMATELNRIRERGEERKEEVRRQSGR
jgi:cytidylate kinase